jgi:peptide/nickel transport system substrate-binding protein
MIRNIRIGLYILILVTIAASSCMVPATGQRVVSPTEQPRYGGTFIFGTSWDEPPTFLMAATTHTQTELVSKNIFDGLVWLDDDWNYHPELAQSWEISADGLTWTFHLVQNATFHDGTPLTSADVKFTMEQISIPLHPMGTKIFGCIDHVETPDKYTAVFKLKYPFAPLMQALTSTYFTVVPKHLYEGTDILTNPYNFKPIGSGPFKFAEYVAGDHVTLVRNENYWRAGRPFLDKLVFRLTADPSSVTRALLAGEMDYSAGGLGVEDLPMLQADPRLEVEMTGKEYASDGGMFILTFNNRQDHITSNQKVRQAILYAIDNDAALKNVGLGLGLHSESAFSPNLAWCYNPNPKVKYVYDPAKANQLLDEAGYPRGPDGIRFHLKGVGMSSYAPIYKNVEFWVPYLKDVGIVLDVERMEYSVFTDRVFKNYQYDITVILISDGPDPSIGMARFLTTDSIKGIPFTNVASYSNSRVDQLFDMAGKETDTEKRKAYFYEIQDILNEEAPMMGIYGEVLPTAWNKDFIGHPMGPDIQGRSEADTYWVKGSLPVITTTAVTTATATVDYLPVAIVLAAIIIVAGIYMLVRRRARAP